mmetsp:Transcript_69006/g.173848  ORF Transcript_69006/g.173848 Transcript_69006/m.173848 type:complete len:354 (-) Transcript_69006:641-1702(-)
MSHPVGVAVSHRASELSLVASSTVQVKEVAGRLELAEQIHAAGLLQEEEDVPRAVHCLVHGDDVRVVEPLESFHLLPQINDPVHVGKRLLLNHLYGLRLPGLHVGRGVDNSEGAVAHRVLQAAGADEGAGGQGLREPCLQAREAIEGPRDRLPEEPGVRFPLELLLLLQLAAQRPELLVPVVVGLASLLGPHDSHGDAERRLPLVCRLPQDLLGAAREQRLLRLEDGRHLRRLAEGVDQEPDHRGHRLPPRLPAAHQLGRPLRAAEVRDDQDRYSVLGNLERLGQALVCVSVAVPGVPGGVADGADDVPPAPARGAEQAVDLSHESGVSVKSLDLGVRPRFIGSPRPGLADSS